MLNNDLTVLIDKFLELQSSTTFFLEETCGGKIHSSIQLQYETQQSGSTLINRAVKLYFNSPAMPILFCKSFLVKEKMTPQEYNAIAFDELPIGRIFHAYNPTESIMKQHFRTEKYSSNSIAKELNVSSNKIYDKQYDYWVDNRKIGVIHEYFNEESLGRI
ncbi:hypothetical protein FNH22_09180 [Fulvivirga sp. M361]|uniref:hypothetical protein n=1 Tax=Fulvivirga sp. M361 TaxID=2594266 RepID=UPI00117ABD00|nr:hypothetical protein [Fulvivirga sp. M361]TRX60210.1 hypothetical protein FNH22_09180 [Fulvivirga sp. M361]